jgi:hypothetical protein
MSEDKINELAIPSENKITGDLCRGIIEFKKGYQPRNSLVKDENGNFFADYHNILSRWKNYFFQLLNLHRVSDVRRMEIHGDEPLVPEHSPFEVGIANAKLKKYKSSRTDHIPAKVIQAGGGTLWL